MTVSGGSVIPISIAAEMETDWRASLRSTPYKSIATIDGGTIWPSPSSTSTSLTLDKGMWSISEAVGSSILAPSWSATTTSIPWSTPFIKPKPSRLTKAQKAMVMDAIAEQLVNPPRTFTVTFDET